MRVLLAFLIGMFIGLSIIGCSPKPDYTGVSIDSLRTASCEEIHDNFAQCKLQVKEKFNEPQMLNYCVNLYIPFYVKKCVEGMT